MSRRDNSVVGSRPVPKVATGVVGTRIGVYSPEEIASVSTCTITDPGAYKLGVPIANGLYDARMGTVHHSLLCATCGQNEMGCPGHFGYIPLCYPVVNVEFIPVLLKLLGCVCYHCSQLLMGAQHPKMAAVAKEENARARLSLLYQHTPRNKSCTNPLPTEMGPDARICGGAQPTYTRDDCRIRVSGSEMSFSIQKLWCILKFIPDDTLRQLGFDPVHSHPVNMLWINFIVPPPCARPPIRVRFAKNEVEDDLTVRLKAVVRCNATLLKAPAPWDTMMLDDSPPGPQAAGYLELCRLIASYTDGKTRGDHVEYGAEKRSLRYRFAPECAKKGRMRGSIFGKRQDYCARSVITPDPYLGVGDIGVPMWMCLITTYPERVTGYNQHRLARAVALGSQQYPGANFIVRKGVEYALSPHSTVDRTIREGDIVRRHLIDGDLVLVNRQPSLHKLSVMCHRVRVLPGHSLRIHLGVTTAYNADFDGDEMNMLVLQSELSRAEGAELMAVGQNIMKDGVAMVRFVQHSVLGAALLCKATTRFRRGDACHLLAQTGVIPETLPPVTNGYITGQSLFGALLPKGLYYMDHACHVVDGALVRCDSMSKSTLNNILAVVATDIGADAATRFVDTVTRVCEHVCVVHGQSIGIDDCAPLQDGALLDRLYRLHASYPGHTSSRCSDNVTEGIICAAMDMVRDVVSSKVTARPRASSNGLLAIVNSGAKGNMSNVTQISGIVGQQRSHTGARLAGEESRVLPISRREGFIPESFMSGLGAYSYFSHLTSSRVGLIDTAVKTSETGYSQRRLTKAMEDVCTDYGQSVILHGRVIQFTYADDGLCGDALSVVTIDFHLLTKHALIKRLYYWTEDGVSPECIALWLAEVHQLLLLRDELRQSGSRDTALVPITYQSPFPFSRLMLAAQNTSDASRGDSRADPSTIRSVCTETWARLVSLRYIYPTAHARAAFFWNMQTGALLRAGITERALADMMRDVVRFAQENMIAPNINIGCIAAQNCTEPLTQMTLNTFHSSGQFSHLVDGVPRMREIMNCVKQPATPTMRIRLCRGVDAASVASSLVSVRMEDVVKYATALESTLTLAMDKSKACRHYVSPSLVANALEALGYTTVAVSDLLCADWTVVMRADAPLGPNVWHTHLCRMRLRGVDGLYDYMTHTTESGESVVTTNGSNLVAALSCPGVDGRYVYTNHIQEIYATLGIDAARMAIVEEWSSVMKTNAASVGIRHIMLIADVMCHYGVLSPITYTGVCNHPNVPVIKKSAFEKTVESFINGASQGQYDNMDSLSTSICFNALYGKGTGGITLAGNTWDPPAPMRTHGGVGVRADVAPPANKCDIVLKVSRRKRPVLPPAMGTSTRVQATSAMATCTKRRRMECTHTPVSCMAATRAPEMLSTEDAVATAPVDTRATGGATGDGVYFSPCGLFFLPHPL